MLKYLAKRIGRSILTLFVIVTLVFCLLRLMPVEGYFANYEKMTEAQIQAGLQSMGLLDPLPVQIGRFWWNALHGDLGVSHIYKVNASVTGILAKKLPISIQMGVFAMLLSLVIGIPMGLLMGRFKNRWPDKIGTAIIVLIQAVPAAVYYLYIQMYGTTALGVGLLFDASDWRYWVLPVCSMSLGNVAFYAMWLRRYMVDESNKDYVRLALAKGVSESNIALRHIFRNAMVPLVQYIPSAFLTEDAVVYDVGSGTGSIAVECATCSPGIRVYAIEQKATAQQLLRRNLEKFHLANVIPVDGKAPDILESLEPPTHVFIGGSSGCLADILHVIWEKNPRTRVVVNAISLETVAQITELAAGKMQTEIIQVQVSRAKTVGTYHLMQAENPVYICVLTMA